MISIDESRQTNLKNDDVAAFALRAGYIPFKRIDDVIESGEYRNMFSQGIARAAGNVDRGARTVIFTPADFAALAVKR